MLDTINWNENFSVREQNGIRNAYATIINQRRWIVYDNTFLEDIDAAAFTKWASISILAHEVGHHYYNHVVSSSGSVPPKELEADAFSGYVLAKLGATQAQAIAAMQAVGTDKASASHPAKNDRIAAISRGWNAAKAASTATIPTTPIPTTPTNPIPTIPAPSTPSSNPQADASWIYLTIQSNKAEQVMLSDDGKTFQPAQIPAGQPFVFKFEIYNYGWLRLKYFNGTRTYKLTHGKDYSILWNRRTGNWSVVEVPN
ncbi:MAG: hypothetical protein EOP53_02390 [Sphingobacteriales bacterium]|nr:MAG: hypothetical protein EOP53_02390 [Sphingobacteriales bacterium]